MSARRMLVGSDDDVSKNDYAIRDTQAWFAKHVTLEGKPYTLDPDQTRAVVDQHKNTLVTARAGSGKTRVIVAKITYLLAKKQIALRDIAVFMFNRTAAAEVNQRISDVKIDRQTLVANHEQKTIASTFHKYALDIIKSAGEKPQIIDETSQNSLICRALNHSLEALNHKVSPNQKGELLRLSSNFVARAGQKFPGRAGLTELSKAIKQSTNQISQQNLFYHQVAYGTYKYYLDLLIPPTTDFNLLMSHATEILLDRLNTREFEYIRKLKYIMIDEYQDFSYLFFALTKAIRTLAPKSKLFAVGDDWQAINRFAGSDVNYFINFEKFFPEDHANIALATNYRSKAKIVDRANRYMLEKYNPDAIPAQAFNRQPGKIKFMNPSRQKFDQTDIYEDCFGDGRYQCALAQAAQVAIEKIPSAAAQLLKQLTKIVQRHRHSEIMILHRHNFTTFEHVSLETLYQALGKILNQEQIMTSESFNTQVRCLTMHKSKGLEAEIVILLEIDHDVVESSHPHANIFQLFGDSRDAESADQKRLLYVAMTRAKDTLYVLSQEKKPLI